MATVRLTRAERGLVRRASNRLLVNEQREFPSSSQSGVSYRTVVMLDGKVMCECRGWTIKKRGQARQCRHAWELIADRPTRTDGEFLYLIQGE